MKTSASKSKHISRDFLAGGLMLLGAVLAHSAEPQNPLGLHVDHITARVADIDRATSWYQQVLGFQLGEHGTRLNGKMKYADLHLPGFGVSLVQLDQPASAASTVQAVVPAWMHIVFSVADPDQLYRTLQERQVHIVVREPRPAGPIKTFLLYDSEGNEIEIVPPMN